MNALDATRRIKELVDGGAKVNLRRIGLDRDDTAIVQQANVFASKDSGVENMAHIVTDGSVMCYGTEDHATAGKSCIAIWMRTGSGNQFTDIYTPEIP